MTVRAELSERAQRDLVAAAIWIAEESPAASDMLVEQVEAILDRLGDFPESGSVREALALPPYRFIDVKGTSYVLVYDSDARPPIVMRILHGARDMPRILGLM